MYFDKIIKDQSGNTVDGAPLCIKSFQSVSEKRNNPYPAKLASKSFYFGIEAFIRSFVRAVVKVIDYCLVVILHGFDHTLKYPAYRDMQKLGGLVQICNYDVRKMEKWYGDRLLSGTLSFDFKFSKYSLFTMR